MYCYLLCLKNFREYASGDEFSSSDVEGESKEETRDGDVTSGPPVSPVDPFSTIRSLIVGEPKVGATFSDVSSEVSGKSVEQESAVISLDSDDDSDSQRESTPAGKGLFYFFTLLYYYVK